MCVKGDIKYSVWCMDVLYNIYQWYNYVYYHWYQCLKIVPMVPINCERHFCITNGGINTNG